MQKAQTVCLVILASVATGFSLFYLRSVLLPFVIALFVVIGCRPVLNFLESRLRLNRYVAFAVAFSVGCALLICFALLISFSINDLRRSSRVYENRLNAIVTWVSGHLVDSSPASTLPSTTETANNTALQTASEDAHRALNELLESASTYLQSQLLQFASSLSSLLSYGVVILIFVFFLLLGQDRARDEPHPDIVREIEARVRQYLVMKTVISAVTGLVFGLVLWLFGVPLALVFGLLAFLLNFIPNIGPLISTLLPVPFLILNSEMSPLAAILCFLLIGAIQFASGNVFETRIMGKSFDVSPVVLLLALMFFGLVWGIIGMFLATPIASILKIIMQQNDATRPFSELMAGRWSGTGNTGP